MLICIVIVLSLPSTWEVFLILLEFVKECVVKSPSKILIFADIPKNDDARACRHNSSHGIPSCPTVIFLAPVRTSNYLAESYKKGTFPLQNVLLILT